MAELVCPECAAPTSKVVDSRIGSAEGFPATRRRRKCEGCSHRWTTYEISRGSIDQLESAIVKRLAAALIDMMKERKHK